MARDVLAQAEPDVLSTALSAARVLTEDHVEAMLKLYEQIRLAHKGHLARLGKVEEKLRTIALQIGALSTVPIETLTPQQVLDLVDYQDEIQSLHQQQGWLAERLFLEASAGRKIQAVIHQAKLAVGYLAGTLADGGEVTDLAELADVQILQAQDDERRRLARDVHDGPAQVLANAVFGLEWCKRMLDRNPTQLGAELENIEHDLRNGLDEVRQFIYDLSPVSFAELGLAASLRRYLQKFSERTGIATNLSIEPEFERVNAQIEMGVFRIIQEALQNVRKHSRATSVAVSVIREESALRVVIVDDGVGFERAPAPSGGGHFGMISMSERARLIHGDLVIDSTPGKGTRVTLSVPVSECTRDF